MTVLATIDYDSIERFKNKSRGYRLIPTIKKDGTEGKPKKEFLFLNVDMEYNAEEFKQLTSSVNPEMSIIKTITLTSNFESRVVVPELWQGRVFARGTLLKGDGLLNLVTVEDSLNLRDLIGMAEDLPSTRFVDGTLLAIKGVPVGRFDAGVAKEMGIFGKEDDKIYFTKEDISYDFFDEVPFSQLTEHWKGFELHFDTISGSKPIILKVRKSKSPKIKSDGLSKQKSKLKPNSSIKKDTFSKLFSEKVEF